MQRIKKVFTIDAISETKQKTLLWGNHHATVAWLDSNQNLNTNTEGLLAVGTIQTLKTDFKNAFQQLKKFVEKRKDYVFGYLGYDLKNDVENLTSNNLDETDFPDLFFFQPLKVIEVSKNQIIFRYPENIQNEIESDWLAIQKTTHTSTPKKTLIIDDRVSKETYINQVEKVLKYIQEGKVYELNYCMEFYAKNAIINPIDSYLELNYISKAPFATFLKFEDCYLLSASPERFLKKLGTTLTSEPIKGTAKRDVNIDKDQQLIANLKNNTKEIAENIMIVDLVRNDLSHIAKKGTVNVDELCKVYSFKQVHQMISSISCEIRPDIHPVDALKACYPMGSMTGAPKIAAMNFIEKLEHTKRGLYSGAVGYFTPEQDFDFNVVIRSILYNKTKNYVSFSVGSAITAKANPEKEYEECLLKAKAMREVLTQH